MHWRIGEILYLKRKGFKDRAFASFFATWIFLGFGLWINYRNSLPDADGFWMWLIALGWIALGGLMGHGIMTLIDGLFEIIDMEVNTAMETIVEGYLNKIEEE
jgi:hypothetical protein